MANDEMSAQFGSAALTQKAEQMLGAMEAQVAPEQAQTVETPAQVQVTPEPAPTFGDDTVVKVKIDGVEKDVPLKELKNGYSRESVFTQRMQTLGQQRQELENYFAQQQAQIVEQQRALQLAQQELQRQNPLAQLQELVQRQNAPKPRNPDEIATLGEIQQAQQALAQHIQQMRQQDQQAFQQALARMQQESQAEFAIRQDQAKFTSALREVLGSEDGQLLSEISPQAESIIRFQTFQQGPQDVDEAIKVMKEYVDGWAGQVKGRLQAQQKAAQVSQAKTVMEPAAGSTAPTILQQKPQIMKKGGGVDYEALYRRAVNLLE